jgi:Uncharacterized conserved protein
LFSAPVRYLIPLFQRPYVWSQEKQWEPLWADVASVAEAILGSSDPASVPPHFLGAVVVEQQRGQVGFIPSWHVIDGQQRLTTLQLLLDAVQEVAEELGDSKDAKALQSLVVNDPDLTAQADDEFKVWPTDRDEDAFRAAMTNGVAVDQSQGATAIARAHAFFGRVAREWALDSEVADQGPGIRIHALVVALRSHLRVVAIDLEDGDNAQVIFETLNYRGSVLLAADLIKNLVFQRAKSQGLNVLDLYTRYWRTLDGDWWRAEVKQGRLMKPRIDTFINHWLVMKLQREVASDRIYAEFRDNIATPEAPLDELLAEISRDASLYAAFERQPPQAPEGRFHYRVLDALDSGVMMPLVLWLLRWNEDDLTVAQRAKALQTLESWLVRRAILRLTTKDLNRAVTDLLARLDQAGPQAAGDLLEQTLLSQDSASRLWPSDDDVRRTLAEAELYQLLTRPRLRMIMEALEDHARETTYGEGTPCPRGLTIEHILPQGWRENWPIAPEDVEAVASRDHLLHTLGNLTLVSGSLNPALSNRPWCASGGQGKRDYLMAHSELKLNASVLSEHADSWDEASIVARSEALAAAVVCIWRRPT